MNSDLERPRILLVTPVRNEGRHIAKVGRSVADQSLPPAQWVVIDDGSTDDTRERLAEMERDIPFLTTHSTPPAYTVAAQGGDRLAAAAAPRAFNFGLRTVDFEGFDYVGKLDGDTELPPGYFETLVGHFQADPTLGIAGGVRDENPGDGHRDLRVPDQHVPGALKLYKTACFVAIGGVTECLGWDAIDEVAARMNGYKTRSFPELVARHHRAWGEAQGALRGRVRYGRSAWISNDGPVWATAKAAKVAATFRPRPLSGAAFLWGYYGAAARRVPRFGGRDVRRHVRLEHRARIRRRVRSTVLG